MVPYAYGCCRRLIRAGAATLGMLVAVMLLGHACAQSGEPIKISQRTLMAVDCSPTMAPPWGYAQLHVLQQAVEATKTLDDAKLADYLREHVFTTVVGDVKFGAKGEWAQSRVLQVQYQNIRDPTSLNSRTCPLRS